MKQFILFVVLATFFSVNAMAQNTKTVTGYLVDKMCGSVIVKKGPAEAMLKAAKHTRECALEPGCAESGYGVVTDGKFVKFDENGDKKAKELLTKSTLKDHILVEVSGNMQGDVLTVGALKETSMQKKKPVKKM